MRRILSFLILLGALVAPIASAYGQAPSLPSPDGVNPNTVFPGGTDCVINQTVGALGVQKGSGGSSTIDYGTAGHPLLSGGGASALDTWDTAGVTCSGSPTSSFASVKGIVTHC